MMPISADHSKFGSIRRPESEGLSDHGYSYVVIGKHFLCSGRESQMDLDRRPWKGCGDEPLKNMLT